MKIKLSKANLQGIEVEGLELEGNLGEYLKIASEVQTMSVANLKNLIETLEQGSIVARREYGEWKTDILNETL